MKWRILARVAAALAALGGLAGEARADMVLSQVIVDMQPDKPLRGDIEVFNDGPDRMYVAADPFEVLKAGTPGEQWVPASDPSRSGILVAPARLVLAPGERRIIRIAAIGGRPASDRVYRVSIRPVAGPVTANVSALKVLVGYQALVLVRPAQFTGDVVGKREGRTLTLTNASNTAQELFQGRQCDAAGKDCRDLPAKRLYPGAEWRQTLPFDTPVSYEASIGPKVRDRQF
jgi:P pilus assembly chaperone PapD